MKKIKLKQRVSYGKDELLLQIGLGSGVKVDDTVIDQNGNLYLVLTVSPPEPFVGFDQNIRVKEIKSK